MDDSCHCEEACHLLDEDRKQTRHRHPKQQRSRKALYILSLLLTNLVTAIAAFNIGETWQSHQSNHSSSTPVDRSPLYADLDRTSRHIVQFSPFSLDPSVSPYTSPASPEVDQAWKDLGVEYFTFLIPPSQASTFSITPDHALMPADAPGANNQSGYAVDMEAMHQLHCLNLLRKGQYFNHEYYSSAENLLDRPSWAFRDPEKNIRGHINHCIDALRERIMCAADDEVLPYWWRDEEGMTISDFAVTRQCKNFEAVRSFAEKHQLPDWGMEYKLETPPDAHVVSDIL